VGRFRVRLFRRFRGPRSLAELAEELPDEGDRREIERLNAYNYGCWDRGCDQGAGLPPPRFDKRP
jgi:hypothetical protein